MNVYRQDDGLKLTGFIRTDNDGNVIPSHTVVRIDVVPADGAYSIAVSSESLPWGRADLGSGKSEQDGVH